MKIITKKYTDGIFDYVCEGVEFPPQKRTIKYNNQLIEYIYDLDGNLIEQIYKSEMATAYLDFPYMQFVLLRNTTLGSVAHYLNFSDKSLLDGGKRYIIYLPNTTHDLVCLGDKTVDTLEEFVSLFWLTSFESKIKEISEYVKCDDLFRFEIPNLWDDVEPLPKLIQHWKRYE